MCSGAAMASHTLMSGKLNAGISLFVGDADAPSCRADQWGIKAEPSSGPRRLGLFDRALDSGKHQLACGTALASSRLMDPGVKIARQVNGGTDGI